MKRIISMILVLTLLLSAISLSVFADTVTDKEQFKQLREELYGSSVFPDDSKNYYWDYDLADEEDDNTNTNGGITPRWNSTSAENGADEPVHSLIIKHAEQLCRDWGEANIIDAYIPLVKDINKECDTMKKTNVWLNNECLLIHGQGNYIATLKYLWTYTLKIAKHKDGDNIEESIDKAEQSAIAAIPAAAMKDSKKAFNNLPVIVSYLVRNNYEPDKENKNHTEQLRCKYILYGIISHFIGDVYAHRVIVPKTVFKHIDGDVTTLNKNRHFQKIYFKDFKRYIDMKHIIKAGPSYDAEGNETAVAFSDMKEYYYEENSEQEVPETVLKNLNKNYIDNAKFYSDRVLEAESALACFISYYSQGYGSYVLEPIYSFSLRKYDKYLENMGE